jgi:hypothetical protein
MRTPWYRHLFYRKQVFKSTWKLRLSVVVVLLVIVVAPRGFWAKKIGQSLVCKEQIAPSDALLIENFDPDYLVFEQAAALQRAGVGSRTFVPKGISDDSSLPAEVSQEFVELLARVARLERFELIPFHEIEPISLNAAKQIREHLNREQIKSVVIVTPGFRSLRSAMVYNAVLAPAGIRVGCSPVFGGRSMETWSRTWHGIQEITLQFLKLQYYRFYVLR